MTPRMPIRGLDEIRKQPNQNFLLKIPQRAFTKMKICIDGNWFLRKYMDVANVHKAFLFGIEEIVSEPLSRLLMFKEENEADLMWVWDGIEFDKPQGTIPMSSDVMLDEGFKEYKQGNYMKVGKMWRNLITKKSEMDVVNKMLEMNGVVVVTTPYSATAQCAYFLNAGVCSYIFGKSDVLLFDGVDKVILDILDECGRTTYLDVFHKSKFLEFLHLNPKLFSILGLALGCDFCPTVPNCASDFSFDKVFMMIKNSDDPLKTIRNSCEEMDIEWKRYVEQFLKGLILITYLPVMKVSGNVLPYYEDHIPRNMDKLIGMRLAPGWYEAMFLNKISHDVLSSGGRESGEFDPLVSRIIDSVMKRLKNEKRIGKNKKDGSTDSFVHMICPGMVGTENVERSTGMLLLKSIDLNQLESPFVPKILCLHNQPAIKNGLDICYTTLKYYINVMRLFNNVKGLKEMYELNGSIPDGLFSKQPVMFSSSFHESFGSDGDSGKSNTRFLSHVREFLKANIRLDPIINDIIKEIDVTLGK